ncbi:hypothetical protein K469DRAFT_690621 [Zopfia rhizophila CBS 207.26]|uniref:Uncharacterized protein n=1 Tax=Zopfia rhizophila CBS 207.26 TaxID=1314779 RepID=A0A6A6DSA6_9PEZI|nr:hypothetical protein K469DRAFT_690621 [Zopfia rhizophila CBS 207.26]
MSQGQPPARRWVDPNFPNPMGPDDATVIIYDYILSLVVGVLGAVLFLIASILQAGSCSSTRYEYLSTVLIGIVFVSLPKHRPSALPNLITCDVIATVIQIPTPLSSESQKVTAKIRQRPTSLWPVYPSKRSPS